MDKADADDSTPPDAGGKPGDPLAPRTVPAVTKAPAPVRSIGGGIYVPPGAPVAHEVRGPPGFPGFVSLRDILNHFNYYASFHNIPTKHWPYGADHRAIDQVIEIHLATGAGRAAGIHPSTGVAVWAPRETWRLSRSFRGRQEYATWRALMGERVRFRFPSQSFECHPLLPCRGMLLAFGAISAPNDPPQWVLDSIREVEGWDQKAPQTEAEAALPAPAPKPPVAEAALTAWWKGYLKQHPNPDKRPDVAEQRAVAAAHFPNHAPPNERSMQKLRNDRNTPPEWREGGRRPKPN